VVPENASIPGCAIEGARLSFALWLRIAPEEGAMRPPLAQKGEELK
jgi:hypothetical protein